MSAQSFKHCNGFPNYIWGWGIEDCALYNRCIIMGLSISQNYKNNTYKKIRHKKMSSIPHTAEKTAISINENVVFNSNDNSMRIAHTMASGLNNIKYTILSRDILQEHVELIKVSI